MFIRSVGALAVAVMAGALTGCDASQQSTPNLSATSRSQRAVSPDLPACYGSNITVKPCPVKLTKHSKHGIAVTVSGPGVTTSGASSGTCKPNSDACFFIDSTSSFTTWTILPNVDACGKGYATFQGFAGSTEVGEYSVKVINKYCPDQR